MQTQGKLATGTSSMHCPPGRPSQPTPVSESPFSSAQQKWLFLEWLWTTRSTTTAFGMRASTVTGDPPLRTMATRFISLDCHSTQSPTSELRRSMAEERQEAPFWAKNGQAAWLRSQFPELRPKGLWLTHMELKSATTGEFCQH